MFESARRLIQRYNLIKSGEKIGVACSGGMDSMCLLHFLSSIKDEIGFSICVINVDHNLRETSKEDSEFVLNYCKQHDIAIYMYKVNAKKLAKDKGLSIESAAREMRYGIFNAIVNKGIVNKIALGHHESDQAETILLNIFRGAGLSGACGMEPMRDNRFIRPLLTTSKVDIRVYAEHNEVPYVEDETNANSDYSRNYVRNVVMPLIRSKWTNVDANIAQFGRLCKQDDEYIYSQINDNSIVYENNNTVKVPINYFAYPASIYTRVVRRALKNIGCAVDMEKKHYQIISGLALEGENGNRVTLPHKLKAIKEYNYITFTNRAEDKIVPEYPFTKGTTDIKGFGAIEVYMLRKWQVGEYDHLVDYNKIPKNAVWRSRKEGDMFTKFGGGTKSLKEYFIDKKVPTRLRDITPVLAVGNEILIVAGVEISDKVKIDENTKTAYGINVVKFL